MIGKLVAGIVIGGSIGGLMGYFGKCSSGACPLTANPYRGAVYGAIVGLISVLIFASGRQQQTTTPIQTDTSNEGESGATPSAKETLLHIESEADFKTRILDAGGISLVDLFSNRCPPCRALAPTISSLADKYAGKVIVCKVDVDRIPAVAGQYGVRAIPTVLIIKDGKEVKRLVGLRPEEEYAAILNGLIGQDKQ